MKRNYVGLSSTCHDPSLAIIDSEGELVFAESLERRLQNKRAWSLPADYAPVIGKVIEKYCDLDSEFVVATSWSRRFSFLARCASPFFRYGNLRRAEGNYRAAILGVRLLYTEQANAWIQNSKGLEYRLGQLNPHGAKKLIRRSYNHHLAHAAAAVHSSPFDQAVCAVIDGAGESTAFSAFRYDGGKLEPVRGLPKRRVETLGWLYSAVCIACGFDWRGGEEWKVMGLAPYGQLDPELYDLIRPMVVVEGCGLRRAKDFHRRLRDLLDRTRPRGTPSLEAADLAFTGQKVFSEIYLGLLNEVAALGISDNLVLSGGCALNSVANGLVLQHSPFKRIHIPCAPGDDGNSVGAASLAYAEDYPAKAFRKRTPSPYLGSSISPESLQRFITYSGTDCERLGADDLCQRVAKLLARGLIVGWVQGRAEFGPRALGNRSILADPRNANIKEIINDRVKFREEFRPFAPSILAEDGPDYFENFQPSPYMERALSFKKSALEKVPGVVHEDGTGRLQTVTPESNQLYYYS